MQPTQKRLFCNSCKREFAHIWRGNSATAPEEGHCPACNGLDIQVWEFEGYFDIYTPKNIISEIMLENTQEKEKQPSITASKQTDTPTLLRMVK